MEEYIGHRCNNNTICVYNISDFLIDCACPSHLRTQLQVADDGLIAFSNPAHD